MKRPTDTQYQALKNAYKKMRHFPNWPSETAKDLGISQPTLAQHLIECQKKEYCIYTSNGPGRTPCLQFLDKFFKDSRA